MNNLEWHESTNTYLEYCIQSKSLSPLTVGSYRQDLNELIAFAGTEPIDAFFAPDRILAYVCHLRDTRNLKPATVKRRIACLRSYAKWLERRGAIAESPFRRMDLTLRIPKRLPKSLHRDQVAKIARHIRTGPKPAMPDPRGDSPLPDATTALAIKLMLATGIRVSELTNIDVGDIAPDASSIRIFGKGSRERTVFVANKALSAELKRRARNHAGTAYDAPLFTNSRGKRLTPQALRLRLRRLSTDLDIAPHLTPHRFRHTAATTLIEEGIDIRFVQRLLGHASISTTELYTHVTDTSLKTAMETANAMAKFGF